MPMGIMSGYCRCFPSGSADRAPDPGDGRPIPVSASWDYDMREWSIRGSQWVGVTWA
jgi:hypothetical protein